jgi:hypothetical protein
LKKTLPNFSGAQVVIFTDEQAHENAHDPLRKWKTEAPNRTAHAVSMVGYFPLAFPEDGVVRVGGGGASVFWRSWPS